MTKRQNKCKKSVPVPWNMKYSKGHHTNSGNLLKTAQLVQRLLKVLYIGTDTKYGKINDTDTA